MKTFKERYKTLAEQEDDGYVADLLEDMGCYGSPGFSMLCPVADYFVKSSDVRHCCVSPDRILIEQDGEVTEHPTPEPVADFLRMFDAGGYPDLVEAT